MLNLFDRQIINILAQDIKVDLSISDAQLGLLTGTAFGIFYSVLGIPLGRVADRVDRVKLIAVALTLWSGFTALCGVAGNFVQLFMTRMGVGVGEAASLPASTAMIPDLFQEGRRTSAMSFLLMGVPVGSFLGLLVGGYVGSTWGWRNAFIVAGIPGFILAAIMWVTMKDPRFSAGAGRRVHSVPLFETLRALFSRPRFKWLALGMICASFFVYAPGAWLPPFFIRVHGMTTAQIGGYLAIAVGLGGAIGTLGSGIVCDLLRERVRDVELKVLMVALGITIPTLLVTLLSPDRSIALASMIVFNICAFSFMGPTVTLIQKEATAQTHAVAIAICQSVSNVLNLGLGLPLVGALSDALTPSHGQEAIRYALVFGAAAVGLVGMLAHWRSLYAAATCAALDVRQTALTAERERRR